MLVEARLPMVGPMVGPLVGILVARDTRALVGVAMVVSGEVSARPGSVVGALEAAVREEVAQVKVDAHAMDNVVVATLAAA